MVNVENYEATGGGNIGILTLDIADDAEKGEVQSGVINVSGAVTGTTTMIVNAENPEVYEGAVEQNRGIAKSVAEGLSSDKDDLCAGETCGNEVILISQKKAWMTASYDSAEISSSFDMDADVKSVTLGVDVYRDNAYRGGEFGFTSRLSGYGAAGYTFSDGYDAYDFNLGLSYAFLEGDF